MIVVLHRFGDPHRFRDYPLSSAATLFFVFSLSLFAMGSNSAAIRKMEYEFPLIIKGQHL
jgi:hypothetical protein